MSDQSERSWVWISTESSAQQEKISALALIETLASIIITISVAIYFETILSMAITVSVAPFLLLRTPESTTNGIKWLRTYEDFYGTLAEKLNELGNKNADLYRHLSQYSKISANVLYFLSNIVLDNFNTFGTILWILSIPVSVLIKILTTSYWTIRRPLYSVRHMGTSKNDAVGVKLDVSRGLPARGQA